MTRTLIISLFLVTLSITANAQNTINAESVTGKWLNQEKDATIEISKTGGGYSGKIIWLKEPNWTDGNPKVDSNNPDPDLRTRPTMGLEILRGFTFKGQNKWDKGTIYDPKSGKTYSCIMTLTDMNTLSIRGFIGISLIGKTTVWTREK
jgi:uncharacterized protein (DUF2147 family)